MDINWHEDIQQNSYLCSAVDGIKIGAKPIDIEKKDIDYKRSLAFQNRTDMTLDAPTVDGIAYAMIEGVSIAHPLAWKTKTKYVIVDGNHRLAATWETGANKASVTVIECDEQTALLAAVVVNILHGRGVSEEYKAHEAKRLHQQGMSYIKLSKLFVRPEGEIRRWVVVTGQVERHQKLFGTNIATISGAAADDLARLEDEQLAVLGEDFVKAPAKVRTEYAKEIQTAPSSEKMTLAHEIKGRLDVAKKNKGKAKPANKPISELQKAMSILDKQASMRDLDRIWATGTEQQRAEITRKLDKVLPMLMRIRGAEEKAA